MSLYTRLMNKVKSFSSKEDGIEILQAVMLAGLAAIVLFFIIYYWNQEIKPAVASNLKTGVAGLKDNKPK